MGHGAGVVRFAGAGAGAELVRVKIFAHFGQCYIAIFAAFLTKNVANFTSFLNAAYMQKEILH